MCHCHIVENDLTDETVSGRVSFRLKQVPIDTVSLKQLLTMVPVGKYNNILLAIRHGNAENVTNSKRLLNSVLTVDIIGE